MQTSAKFLVALIASLLWTASAAASTVQYTFSANTSFEIRNGQLATPEQTIFAPGALVSGSFEYDSASPLLLVSDTGSLYGSVSNLMGSIEGSSFSDAHSFSFVSNNGFDLDPLNPDNPLVDLLAVVANGSSLNGFLINNQGSTFLLVNVRLLWFSPQGDFLSDESLPAVPSADTQIARLALDFQNILDPSITHNVFADALVVAPVPLPAAAWLFVSALGMFRFLTNPARQV